MWPGTEVVSGKQLSQTNQLANESIAILQGSAFDVFAQKVYPNADLQFYNTIADMLAAVEKEKSYCRLRRL